jgi:YesN/AraC family two-component response regulator
VWIDCQPFYSIKARALLLLILHRLLELVFSHTPSSLKDIRIEKAVNHITRHYEKKISIREMAAMTGLNATYFGVLFRQETGMSMNRYLIRTRIRNAEYMLRSGNHTVEETAKRCGYSDKWYFYKQFKKVCGIPPSACIPKKKRY